MSASAASEDVNQITQVYPGDVPLPNDGPVPKHANYKGFVAGVFSGIAKLSVGHPFDTIKVRLQTTQNAQFKGPLDCLMQTIRKEGIAGVYKGATPPLLGWMAMDSVMLGSLTFYRRLLRDNIFSNPSFHPSTALATLEKEQLPSFGHGLAGILAGSTVSLIAAPVEHVKARLQIQYAATKPRDSTAGRLTAHAKYFAPTDSLASGTD
jgi:solute carrier family 25 carnitine/acylcarnitine transporter 20/29